MKDKEFLYERVLVSMFLEKFAVRMHDGCMIFKYIIEQIEMMFEELNLAFDMPTRELVQEIIFKTIQGKLNHGK